ncbi:MAG: hypothetical protein HFI90_04290 [Clostridia bacterium]|nr:hypothetical protein [Clostridia bacterium]
MAQFQQKMNTIPYSYFFAEVKVIPQIKKDSGARLVPLSFFIYTKSHKGEFDSSIFAKAAAECGLDTANPPKRIFRIKSNFPSFYHLTHQNLLCTYSFVHVTVYNRFMKNAIDK